MKRVKRQIFLWPEGKIRSAMLGWKSPVRTDTLETALQAMFPSGYPVLCSSGRVALILALQCAGLVRRDLIGTFPFASHCVLDAVARVATPVGGEKGKSLPARIVYHQWGYVQESNLAPGVIEDCADTLCEPGTALFPAGGDFEVWSLTKILGTTCGGVLWCKDENLADRARRERDNNGGGSAVWLLRMLGRYSRSAHAMWQGLEPVKGRMGVFQGGELKSAFSRWPAIVADRKLKLEKTLNHILEGVKLTPGRLPPVVPVSEVLTPDDMEELALSSGTRTFWLHTSDYQKFKAVTPIPIHQDITTSHLDDILDRISLRQAGIA